MLRVELVLQEGKCQILVASEGGEHGTHPEVATSGQTGETDDLVVRLAQPGDLPAAQIVDGRERVGRRDAERDCDTTAPRTRGWRRLAR